jgi:hypothetical protein
LCKLLILLEFLPLYFSTEIGDNNSMEMRNEIKVGDVVKSLDFVSVNDCYYVGLVTDIFENEGRFRATTVKRVWDGSVVSKIETSETFESWLPGHQFFDDMAEEKGVGPRVQVVA